MPTAVQFQDISKRFGSFVALSEVSLQIASGEIHAIVGENGAGKSTLMNILSGKISASQGELQVHGKKYEFKSPAEAAQLKIGMVSQHYSIIPELTCIQNLILGSEPKPMLDWNAIIARATELAGRMEFAFDWNAPAEKLSPGKAQQLEILKLLWRDSEILVLDEPTAMLSPDASDSLYASLKRLSAQGKTVIVVTHRLSEVLEHAEQVTVLRGGRMIESRKVAGLTEDELAAMMVGESVALGRVAPDRDRGTPAVQIRDLVVRGDRKNRAVDGANLSVHSREVLGIAGVDGNGQREFAQALLGVRPSEEGKFVWNEVDCTNFTAAQRIAMGCRNVPEDRLNDGAIESWSIRENIRLGLQRIKLDFEALVSGAIALLGAKVVSPNQPFASLSGGNQQRVILGKAIESSPELVVAFQPVRGLDVKATREAYRHFRSLEKPVIVFGFDLEELLEQCDRVVVMSRGRILEPPAGQEMDKVALGKLMAVDD